MSVGVWEIVLLMIVGGFWLVVLLVVLAVVASRRGSRGSEPRPISAPPPPCVDLGEASTYVVARLTQRFCPQCRAPLGADSPEGLCPACLMAGGLGHSMRNATEGAPYSAVNGMAATTPPSGSQPPATGEWADLQRNFPDYEILELLGRGGMGTVYKARQKKLDRLVALKVIPPDAAKDPAFTERFAREARAMARLNHPNIVTVHDYGHEGELCWLTMEYVDGVNLRHALRAGRLAPKEGLAIVPQICDALQYAHDQGVVHRDIKPENVLLDRSGRVKIADFGLAKLLGKGPDDFTLTGTQQVMGTPRYMAPEQIERPSTVDHRADIYSLGVVLYEMLTGELPLGRFEPPSHKVQIDVRIDQVVLRALEKSPDRRYQRASEVKTELASAVSWPTLAVPVIPAATVAPAPPVWHTPEPATKHDSASMPGGVPLGMVLAVAIGMVLGMLMVGAGTVLCVGAFLIDSGNEVRMTLVGSGFGVLLGGAGAFFGSFNSYRQLAGAVDLMRSPLVTWFDYALRVYFAVGIAVLIAGIGFAPTDDKALAQVLMTIGGVLTLQGGLSVLWRWGARQQAIAADGIQRPATGLPAVPTGPSYLRAVAWPTLAIAAVFAMLLADVHFATPQATSGGLTHKIATCRQWQTALLVTAAVALPLCLIVLAGWRTLGPRQSDDKGRHFIPFPFAHRAWLWGIAALAAVSLFLPWYILEVHDDADLLLNTKDIYSNAEGYSVIHARSKEVQEMANMASGWRYAYRGIQEGSQGAAAALLVFAALLSAIAFEPHHPSRLAFLLVFGGISLLLVTTRLHQAADQHESVVIDATTELGISMFAARHRGSEPQSIEPWRRAVRTAVSARPTIGVFVLLAACGLAIFVGVTELSWGGVSTLPPLALLKPKVKITEAQAPLDPARQAVLNRVAGPGIGLVVAGVFGLLPLLIALLAIPAWSVTPYREPLEFLDGGSSAALPSGLLAIWTSSQVVSGVPAGTAALALPPLLAYQAESTPPQPTNVMWMLTLPIFLLMLALNLAHSITLIIGGWRMRQAKSYGLAMVAAILALLPCTFGWIIGLPIGIWALTVLIDPAVKSGFEA